MVVNYFPSSLNSKIIPFSNSIYSSFQEINVSWHLLFLPKTDTEIGGKCDPEFSEMFWYGNRVISHTVLHYQLLESVILSAGPSPCHCGGKNLVEPGHHRSQLAVRSTLLSGWWKPKKIDLGDISVCEYGTGAVLTHCLGQRDKKECHGKLGRKFRGLWVVRGRELTCAAHSNPVLTSSQRWRPDWTKMRVSLKIIHCVTWILFSIYRIFWKILMHFVEILNRHCFLHRILPSWSAVTYPKGYFYKLKLIVIGSVWVADWSTYIFTDCLLAN